MDFRTSPLLGTRHLYGVAKTLRRLYEPPHEPCGAIEQALAALAFLDAERSRISRRDLVLASVA